MPDTLITGSVTDFNLDYGTVGASLFDGIDSTWAGSSGNWWVELDAGTAVPCSKISIQARPSFPDHAVGIVFQGSPDNSTWTDLYTIASNPAANPTFTDYTPSDTTTSFRYFRISGGVDTQLGEVQFYTAGSSASVPVPGGTATLTGSTTITGTVNAGGGSITSVNASCFAFTGQATVGGVTVASAAVGNGTGDTGYTLTPSIAIPPGVSLGLLAAVGAFVNVTGDSGTATLTGANTTSTPFPLTATMAAITELTAISATVTLTLAGTNLAPWQSLSELAISPADWTNLSKGTLLNVSLVSLDHAHTMGLRDTYTFNGSATWTVGSGRRRMVNDFLLQG